MMMQTTSASRAWRALRDHRRAYFCCSGKRAGRRRRCARRHRAHGDCPDASRIVSIGGAVTEILYALGQDKRVVAIDITSLYPVTALKEKPNVGYLRQLSPEGVLGLYRRRWCSRPKARDRRRPSRVIEAAARSVRACAGPVHRRGHCREDQAHRDRDRPGQAGRMPCQERGRRSRGDGEDARGGHETRRGSCSSCRS